MKTTEEGVLWVIGKRKGDMTLNDLYHAFGGTASHDDIAGAVWKWLQEQNQE
jgi:hypothetical protein